MFIYYYITIILCIYYITYNICNIMITLIILYYSDDNMINNNIFRNSLHLIKLTVKKLINATLNFSPPSISFVKSSQFQYISVYFVFVFFLINSSFLTKSGIFSFFLTYSTFNQQNFYFNFEI